MMANSLISFLWVALLAFPLRRSAITALHQSGVFRPEKTLMMKVISAALLELMMLLFSV